MVPGSAGMEVESKAIEGEEATKIVFSSRLPAKN